MRYLKLFAVILIITLLPLVSNAGNQNIYKNFEAKYNFEFSGMTVAKGTLLGQLDNDTYTVRFSGKTTRFISIFYKLKEIIDGAINISSGKDMYYKSIEKRPHIIKIVSANFTDNSTAKVKITKNSKDKTYILSSKDGVFSPLYLYIFFMSHKIEIGKTYFKDVVVTKKLYRVAITILKETTINTDKLKSKKGRHKALEVEIRFYKIENGKIIKNKKIKKIVAWVLKKSPNIPILIQSWNFIGIFRARLTSLKLL